MRIIAVANHKGGCGKTTTAIHWSACLARLGKKILLVDLDPQGHSTCGLGVRAEELRYTLYDLLHLGRERPLEFSEFILELTPNLFLAPSYGILGALEEEWVDLPERYERLRKEIHRLLRDRSDIDYVVFDCPPNLGLLTYNALEAADEVVIPIEPSFFSLHGLAKISETLRSLDQNRLTPIKIHALLTLFNSRTAFAQEVFDEVKTYFRERLFKTLIHESVALKEAAAAGKNIVDYDPKSMAYHDYMNLALEYLRREWDDQFPESGFGWDSIVERRLGPRRAVGGVLFQALAPRACEVEIAGDFNHWVPEPMIRRDERGLWQKVLPVSLGRSCYKFIVDGEWQVDPFQPRQRSNPYGGRDSVLEMA